MLKWLETIIHNYLIEIIVVAAALFIIRVIISLIITSCAKKKGRNELLCFFGCLIFGICGFIVVAALPDKKLRAELEYLCSQKNADDECSVDGIIPQSNDTRSPAGTTAYMPRSMDDSVRAQNGAVERIKTYWTEAGSREEKADRGQAKACKKVKPSKEKEIKTAKTKKKKTQVESETETSYDI